MHSTFHRLKSSTLARYIIVGGTSYTAELSVLYGIIFTFHTTPTFATAAAFWVGLTISFVLQKIFAFSNKLRSAKHLSRQATLYISLVAFNYAFTVGFVFVFKDCEVIITRTLALVITTSWNFFVFKHLIFKDIT